MLNWLVHNWSLVLLAVTAAAFAAILLLMRRRCRNEQAVRRFFEALGRVEAEQLLWPETIEQLPPLPEQGAWAAAGRRFCESLKRLAEMLQSNDHARMAMEVRMTRNMAEAQRLRGLFAGLPDPVVVLDEFNESVLTNRAADEALQLDPREPQPRALTQLARCEKLVSLLTSTAQHRMAETRECDLELPGRDGQTRTYRVSARKLAAAGAQDETGVSGGTGASGGTGVSGGAVAVLRDIGDLKKLQKRNAEFVSSVSHEMKTPLAGIKAYVELLADGDAEDDATRDEFLGVIEGQADRLQRLVENLLNLARIEAGVVQVNKKPQSLNDVLEEAQRVVQPSAEAKQITLAADLSPLYLGVFADRDMLLQSAINLLSNAIKYTPAGGKVTLRSRMDNDEIRFEVADTGVGLSPEDCTKVFEKFYRVNKDKHMAAGTGLGLPLAKHIVEDVHGGRLTVESTLGAGSTFIITLPNAGQRT